MLRLFGYSSLAFVVLALVFEFIFPSLAIDIQMHDTYFVIGFNVVFFFISLYFSLGWLMYRYLIARRIRLANKMKVTFHYWISFVFFLVLTIPSLVVGSRGMPDFHEINMNNSILKSIHPLKSIITAVFVMAQLIPISLIIMNIFKTNKT